MNVYYKNLKNKDESTTCIAYNILGQNINFVNI